MEIWQRHHHTNRDDSHSISNLPNRGGIQSSVGEKIFWRQRAYLLLAAWARAVSFCWRFCWRVWRERFFFGAGGHKFLDSQINCSWAGRDFGWRESNSRTVKPTVHRREKLLAGGTDIPRQSNHLTALISWRGRLMDYRALSYL